MKKVLLRAISLVLCLGVLLCAVGCGGTASTEKKKKKKTIVIKKDPEVSDITDDISDNTDSDTFVPSGGSYTDSTENTTADKPETVKPLRKFTVNGTPRVYLTTANSSIKFRRQDDSSVKVYSVSQLDRTSGTVIETDGNKTYQTIDGFGASLTDSSCYNLMSMPEELRNELMTKLFDKQKGIGLSFLRQPVGSTDFSLEYHTYDDVPEGQSDWNLTSFSIDRDKQQMIPLIKQAMALNSDMKVVSSVWSAPLWMKNYYQWSSYDLASGNDNFLRPECYDVFSQYLIKYIKAYQAEGIDIYAISPQNEPYNSVKYPGMKYTANQMLRLIKYSLKPAFEEAGVTSKIWCFDESWNKTRANDYVGQLFYETDGMAFHFYSGDASVMGAIHELFPDYKLYMTETAGMYQSQPQQLFRQIKHFTQSMRNYASSWIGWNICLDQNYGPLKDAETVNAVKGTGLTEYNTETGKLAYQMDFYALAHFSKFIQQGAVVIESTDVSIESEECFYNIAALNENGTMTVVIGNQLGAAETFKIVVGDKVIELAVAGESVVTVNWDANC